MIIVVPIRVALMACRNGGALPDRGSDIVSNGHRAGLVKLMFKRKQATRVDLDGRMYMANRRRRRSFPFTGFLFVMICLWSAKAMMVVQTRDGYYVPHDVVLDIEHPILTVRSLVMYPDPVTVWLAETFSAVLA